MKRGTGIPVKISNSASKQMSPKQIRHALNMRPLAALAWASPRSFLS